MRRHIRQEIAVRWATRCFGPDHVNSPEQRAVRFLEEAIELYQATGADREMALKLVNFVFDRPVGDVENELGGVGLTLLLIANATGHDADAAEEKELLRVLEKPRGEFAARNQKKNDAGFLATAYPVRVVDSSNIQIGDDNRQTVTAERQIGKSPVFGMPYGRKTEGGQ